MPRYLLLLFFVSPSLFAQRLSKQDKQALRGIQQHLVFLSADALKGRRAGDSGEIAAANYIADRFSAAGLLPKGDEGAFTQEFSIYEGKKIDPISYLRVNTISLRPSTDFFPLAHSISTGTVEADLSPSINESGQPWMVDISEFVENNTDNPHVDYLSFVTTRAREAKEKGATMLFFYQSVGSEKITFDPKDRSDPTPLPVVYISQAAWQLHFSDPSSTHRVALNTGVLVQSRTARNVVGFMDNGASQTIVVGAHFDHLGYGEDGNSMLRGGKPDIHNGADDNASGTSAMLELVQQLSNIKSQHNNYLFIAFSAEELGLNGSKYFVENPTVPLSSINYMINMDMVGRLNDSTKTLTIGGFGTSPSWRPMMDAVKKRSFTIKLDSSGTGPSDHTSFYRKGIPVLFFFTGLHSDYHKPSDDADKINYLGIFQVVRFIHHMIEADRSEKKLVFTKTREQQTGTATRFSVSMGIMPDYTFSGAGVRVDGVSENRPAKAAGIQAGDIIKQLGDLKTQTVELYMQALATFKKGDKTVVLVLRSDKEIMFDLVF